MTLLESFIASPWAGALGWTILHSFWEGALVSAAVGVVILAAQSPRVRYAAACLGMVSILAGFCFTLLSMAPATAHQFRARSTLPFRLWKDAEIRPLSEWQPNIAVVAPWLALFWITGVLFFNFRHGAGYFYLYRLRSRGVCSALDLWRQKLWTLSTQLHISKHVRLLESSLADVPMVIGYVRPLILMPIGMLGGLPGAQIEAILLHELAHIRRHDYLVNSLQNLIDSLLFYHPAIWWISHVVRAEREKCCDDIVVETSGNAHEYALALTALEEIRWSGHEWAVAARGGSLMKRIQRLLYPTAPKGAWVPILATAILLTTAGVGLGGLQVEQSHRAVSAISPQDSNDAYSKWLSEDVVYIINDAERAAFRRLATNEERNHFIEQFWERRNPAPGAPENKFKEEHYRRIAFANQRYAGSAAGWQTDRGHMYIVYGPPDEIESHPKGGERVYATEIWAYHLAPGTTGMSFFTFVDKTGRGDYHLAPSNGH